MLLKYYNEFMNNCRDYLENHEEFGPKLKDIQQRLGKYEYDQALTSRILGIFETRPYPPYQWDPESICRDEIDHLYHVTQKMCKVYTFDVWVKGYKKELSRRIQVPYQATLHTLVIAILMSFRETNFDYTLFTDLESYKYNGEEDLYYVLDSNEYLIGETTFTEDKAIEISNQNYRLIVSYRDEKLLPTVCRGLDRLKILKGKGYGIVEDLKQYYKNSSEAHPYEVQENFKEALEAKLFELECDDCFDVFYEDLDANLLEEE